MFTNKFQLLKGGGEKNRAAEKARLRSYMKERRGDNENRDVKEALLVENFRKVLETEWGRRANSFLVYLSFSSEAPTDRLIEELLAAGKTVYCPRVAGEDLEAVLYGEELALSDFGIREPTGEPFLGEIDVCVVPLLAVDGDGNRLGYGKGYYDRFLRKTKAAAVGFCFDFQVLKSVPTEEWDKPMAAVVTDKRVVFCGRETR